MNGITPTISITGIVNNEVHGSIHAEKKTWLANGKQCKSEWSISIPFGRYVEYDYDRVYYKYDDGSSEEECEYEAKRLVGIDLYAPKRSALWQVLEERLLKVSVAEQALHNTFGVTPKGRFLEFKSFPTLETIDSVWCQIAEMGATLLTIKKDVIVLKVGEGYVPFSTLLNI